MVDEFKTDVDYDSINANFLNIPEIFNAEFSDLAEKYGIAELCTVVKPGIFKYLNQKNKAETIIYLDPDIEVYSEFKEVFQALTAYNMILTPHICSPTGDIGHPLDKDLMRTGIYNLGFLAMNINKHTLSFLNWWEKRVKEYGYHDLKEGYFYDQIWLGYAPAFLDKVYILRHLGYNMANWNLHERTLLQDKEVYYVNDMTIPLRFYHFSHFKIENLPEIAAYNDNFSLDNRPDIIPLYENYRAMLLDNQYAQLNAIDYRYGKRTEQDLKRGRVRLFARHMLLAVKALLK